MEEYIIMGIIYHCNRCTLLQKKRGFQIICKIVQNMILLR